MKKVIYNEDNLHEKDINHVIKRAKLLLVNNKDEFLLCHSFDAYHIIGGHVDNDESDVECIIREVKEETGIVLNDTHFTPLMQIVYYCKDYPQKGINTKYIASYYYQKTDLVPDMRKAKLTYQEKTGHFEIESISKNRVMEVLEEVYQKSTKKNVVRDTMDVIKEYLKSN